MRARAPVARVEPLREAQVTALRSLEKPLLVGAHPLVSDWRKRRTRYRRISLDYRPTRSTWMGAGSMDHFPRPPPPLPKSPLPRFYYHIVTQEFPNWRQVMQDIGGVYSKSGLKPARVKFHGDVAVRSNKPD